MSDTGTEPKTETAATALPAAPITPPKKRINRLEVISLALGIMGIAFGWYTWVDSKNEKEPYF